MSQRRMLNLLGILILMGITALVSVGAYIMVIGGSGEASQPISAPTLDLSTPTPNAEQTQVAVLSAQVADLQATIAALEASSAAAEATVEAAVEPTAEPTVVPTTEPTPAAAAPSLYRIVSDESQVSFTLTEDLRGQFTTVIGTTNQVAGDIQVDFATPANSRLGVIRINARTLATDNEFRNRALRSEILESSNDAYEFIDFTPAAVSGLPETLAVGEAVTFQVTGDLKIREITQSVTFDVTATAVSEDRLEGTATAAVTRAQFNLTIPSVPGVANVSDEVTLEIKFVATKVAG